MDMVKDKDIVKVKAMVKVLKNITKDMVKGKDITKDMVKGKDITKDMVIDKD